jgi:phosphoglycolate phosphatase-like HAD superfamily hydrolase
LFPVDYQLRIFYVGWDELFVNGRGEMKKIVIFDLDGTIALIDHRRHFVEKKGPKASDEDWRNFFAACVDDQPNQPVIEILRALRAQGYYIVILSGRSDEVGSETKVWLKANDVPYDELHMRPEGNYEPDQKWKARFISRFEQSKILCVFDDRDKVVDMWRSKGITCFQVAPGDF